MTIAPAHRAVVVDDPGLASDEALRAVLEAAGFWQVLAEAQRSSGREAADFSILIRPDLAAFERDSPAATSPALVERLVDWLHARGYPKVNLCSSADSSWFWTENRDVAVLADLLGYRYETPGGHAYDVLDLSTDLVDGGFAPTSALAGTPVARAWRDAGFRIVMARNKTDEREGYVLCLAGLLDVLPLVDKDTHYRFQRQAGDAVAELLRTLPPQFAIIDATVSAHGNGGSRAPRALATRCVIAGASPLLADLAGAMKMGLDPQVSPLVTCVHQALGLPERYALEGNLAPHAGWLNAEPVLLDSVRRRDQSPAVSRLLSPWLQRLDPGLFPLKQLLDARLNPGVSEYFGAPDEQPGALALLVAVNHLVGTLAHGRYAWNVLYDKEAIARVQVPLGFDPAHFTQDSYAAIRPELDQLEELLKGTTPAAEGLRWREHGGATVFEFVRDLPIPFGQFVARVDVARTIQYMNDYIGGVVVPVLHDDQGRVVCQVERNVYLPQPNYLVLYQGKPIDVGKIESCDYAPDRHRMYWKTLVSANGSATHDDGVVSFTRSARGTQVRIVGRQLFTLPPFWQVFNLNLVPALKAPLVTHAYHTFFTRTCANFEALVEGRDIRIGKSWHDPAHPFDGTPMPAQQLEDWGRQLIGQLEALAAEPSGDAPTARLTAGARSHTDAEGFRHFRAEATASTAQAAMPLAAGLRKLLDGLADFLTGYAAAVQRDATPAAAPPPEPH